ncbi:MAG TPA: hypothetical protein VMB50_14280 [Myxococcales bacterium]|nr:hypothetical protein [Myxococcales bacterium]
MNPTAFRFAPAPARRADGSVKVSGSLWLAAQLWARPELVMVLIGLDRWKHLGRPAFWAGIALFAVVASLQLVVASFEVTSSMTELAIRQTVSGLIPLGTSTFPLGPGSKLVFISPEKKPWLNPLLTVPATLVRLEGPGTSVDVGRVYWEHAGELARALEGISPNLTPELREGEALSRARAKDEASSGKGTWWFTLLLTAGFAAGIHYMFRDEPAFKDAADPKLLALTALVVVGFLAAAILLPMRMRQPAKRRLTAGRMTVMISVLQSVIFYEILHLPILLAAAALGLAVLVWWYPSDRRLASLEEPQGTG